MIKNILIKAFLNSSKTNIIPIFRASKPQLSTINLFRNQHYYFSENVSKEGNPELIKLVEEKVFNVLKSAAKCKVEKLGRAATFEDLGFDSLDSVELVVAMEENFGFDISNEEAEKIQTVSDAILVFYKHSEEKIKAQEITK